MARGKDLAGLASLAGLAYLASQSKGNKGADRDTDTGVDVLPSYARPTPVSAPSTDLGEIRDETGALSNLRRNTETGDLYSPNVPITSPAAPRKPAASVRSTPSVAGRENARDELLMRQGRPVMGRDKYASTTPEGMVNYRSRAGMRGMNPENQDVSDMTYKKGGKVKDKAPSVKGWGIARGARKAKMY